MYSRQNRSRDSDIPVELPRDYSGNAFSPFARQQGTPMRGPREEKRDPPAGCENRCEREEKREEEKCEEKNECECTQNCECRDKCEKEENCVFPKSGGLHGLSGLTGLLGGNIGLEELLLLGVIFLIFSDGELRDSELLICLLLILFI